MQLLEDACEEIFEVIHLNGCAWKHIAKYIFPVDDECGILPDMGVTVEKIQCLPG